MLPEVFYKLIKYSYKAGDRVQRDSVLNFHLPISKGSGTKKYPLIEIIRA